MNDHKNVKNSTLKCTEIVPIEYKYKDLTISGLWSRGA